uniref:Uncharacterized protein n=1 Tax=Anguilla anguilla TaxID=7936 RepID=A0A0E9UDK4_ANGAN
MSSPTRSPQIVPYLSSHLLTLIISPITFSPLSSIPPSYSPYTSQRKKQQTWQSQGPTTI